MSQDGFQQGAIEFYHGEIIGEVLFDRLLTHFRDPDPSYKIAVMLQLETETKARLRPFIMVLGHDPTEPEECRRLGIEMADSFADTPWSEFLPRLHELVQPYVERYQEIADLAPAEHEAIARSMVVHERSLQTFAEREMAGDTKHSLDDVIAQLKYPLPRP